MTRDEQVHGKAVTTIALVGTLVSVACLLVGAYMEAFYMAGASLGRPSPKDVEKR
jgi:hypothetical protein